MSERKPITNPDEVQQPKESILEHWQRLPPDHQATVLVEHNDKLGFRRCSSLPAGNPAKGIGVGDSRLC